MDSALFQSVVDLFNGICRTTGLSYEALNILVYTCLLPCSWWFIVWMRLQTKPKIWLANLAWVVVFFIGNYFFENYYKWFYLKNVGAIWQLGDGTEPGYIHMSVNIGIIIPATLYFLLLVSPKRVLFPLYILYQMSNLGWYVWALNQ